MATHKETSKICKAPFKTQCSLLRKLFGKLTVLPAALEAQAANMANIDNTTRPREAPELATLCPTMVLDSEKMMEVFIRGLPRSIKGNVTTSKPQTLKEAINIAQRLMDQGFAAALAVLVTGASQSRQHESHHHFFPVDTSLIHIESRKSPTKSLFDVGSRRISIFTVNTKEYHSDVLAIITRIMRRT
ncbi:hypothetical protein Tco_1172638 [Tanacetum coccineum]